MEDKICRYVVKTDRKTWEGWGFLYTDPRFGIITIHSDYGDYCYRFSSYGDGDFRTFLLRLDPHYLMEKLSHGDRVVDPVATAKHIKETILFYRREGWLNREEAREEWDRVKETDFSREEEARDWCADTRMDDAYEYFVYDFPPRVKAFVDRCWPRLMKEVEKELKKISKH